VFIAYTRILKARSTKVKASRTRLAHLAFLTLFLGLTSGAHTVALAPGPGIAAIELQLDGAAAARLTAAPWSASVDFGPGLLPHHLVARGLDGQGSEVAACEQWINLPRPPAEVEIVIEKAVAGQPRTVRLAWQSATNEIPAAIALTLDGKRLALDGSNRAQLPLHPAGSATQVLSAELTFHNGVVARRDLALGREYDDEVSTALTSVPVWLRDASKLPPPAEMSGWFRSGDKALRVDAVEAGAVRLVVVRAPRAAAILDHLSWIRRAARLGSLPNGSRLRFLSAYSHPYLGPGIPFELFDGSRYLDAHRYGVAYLVARTLDTIGARPRLADAVAVAGMRACAEDGPRAVLLLLTPGTRDLSRHDGVTVRRYLAALRVPLFVWSAGPPDADSQAAWGAVEDVTDRKGMQRALLTLDRQLAAQQVILLEGHHLPQSITFAPAAGPVVLEPP
jgi:hypothetical protein